MGTLLSTDRCDRCGAQAYVRFISADNKRELDFCGHHTNKYADVLDAQGFNIEIDDRELLTKRAVGAEVA